MEIDGTDEESDSANVTYPRTLVCYQSVRHDYLHSTGGLPSPLAIRYGDYSASRILKRNTNLSARKYPVEGPSRLLQSNFSVIPNSGISLWWLYVRIEVRKSVLTQ